MKRAGLKLPLIPWAITATMACSLGRVAQGQWTAIPLQSTEMYTSRVLAGSGKWQGGQATVGSYGRVVLWDLSAGKWVDLTPPGYLGGQVLAAFGRLQAGVVGNSQTGHAALWSGTAASFVDLHPASNPYISQILAMDGQQQVGSVRPTQADPYHRAAIWHGTAASYVNLHPSGKTASTATACAVGLQGGWYQLTAQSAYHAALWSGSAQSMIDLHLWGSGESRVLGMAPGHQVGWVNTPTIGSHAAMWHGSAASFTDMNPPGYAGSQMYATCGTAQAGYASGVQMGAARAGVWFGTPESFVSLAPFTPTGYGQSIATSISFFKGVYYVGGYANNNATGLDEAFVWIGAPGLEPGVPGTPAPAPSSEQIGR